jgi:hypothetical protein
VAVYGYTGGEFTVTAVTRGVILLQAGRSVVSTVAKHDFRYFSLLNPNPFARLTFSVSVTSGDADLYITTHLLNSTVHFPTLQDYTWRSVKIGSDSLTIDYLKDAAHYCYDCDYVVGVYGYKNTTFTLTALDSPDTIVRLAGGRPVVFSLAAGRTQYFSAETATSADDLLVALTPLDSGTADMYLQVFNASFFQRVSSSGTLRLPDPADPSTYQMDTADGAGRNFLLVPGPHSSIVVAVVAVVARSSVKFSLMAKTSQTPVTLQVPSS